MKQQAVIKAGEGGGMMEVCTGGHHTRTLMPSEQIPKNVQHNRI